ncbi:hypothetical protein SDC9_124575 [bioreactor metagenome]|uniref:Uncharacterized protein n=1 Tax=bioreactor metagenome TaxID=1076179 RepID=A0A645CKW6_9ZZZZ
MALRGEQGRGLVHPAGGCPDHLVLGPYAGGAQPRPAGRVTGQAQAEGVVQGERHRALDRGGGGQSGPPRHAGHDGDVEATQLLALLTQAPGRAGRVAHPGRDGTAGPDVVEGALPARRVGVGRDEPDHSVVAAAQRHVRAVRQRDRQAGAAVVVDVLTDQVDPSGRRPDPVGCGAGVGLLTVRLAEEVPGASYALLAGPAGDARRHRPCRHCRVPPGAGRSSVPGALRNGDLRAAVPRTADNGDVNICAAQVG